MPSNTENVKLGVCSVTFGGVDLGFTQGGVEVDVATTTREVKVDQMGDAPINEYIMGRTCSAKVPLAETTLENLVRIMPGAVLHSSGGAIFRHAVRKRHSAGRLGATIADAAANLAAVINASIDHRVLAVSAKAVAGVVTITADDEGTYANAFALTKQFAVSANCTLSGPTLTGGQSATKRSVSVPNGVGLSLLSRAKELVLHPIANDPTDHSDDFIIPLAMTPGAMQFSFKLDQERLFPVDFKAYPDPVTKTLFIVGDKSTAAV